MCSQCERRSVECSTTTTTSTANSKFKVLFGEFYFLFLLFRRFPFRFCLDSISSLRNNGVLVEILTHFSFDSVLCGRITIPTADNAIKFKFVPDGHGHAYVRNGLQPQRAPRQTLPKTNTFCFSQNTENSSTHSVSNNNNLICLLPFPNGGPCASSSQRTRCCVRKLLLFIQSTSIPCCTTYVPSIDGNLYDFIG